MLVPVLLLIGAGGGRQPVTPSRAGLLLAGLASRYGIGAALLALALLAGGLAGWPKLQPEDRPLERFGSSTGLYRGMQNIDREFGGADTLAIVLDADAPGQAGAGSANPWYSVRGLQRLRQVHDYLDALEESGKVGSLALFGATAAELLGAPVDDQRLAAAWRAMPAQRRALLLEPWLSATTARTLIVMGLDGTRAALPRAGLVERHPRAAGRGVRLRAAAGTHRRTPAAAGQRAAHTAAHAASSRSRRRARRSDCWCWPGSARRCWRCSRWRRVFARRRS